MNSRSFLKYLSFTIVFAIAIHFFINLFLPISTYNDILIYAVIFFTLICILVYWMSVRGIQTKKNNYFLYIIIVNVFVKLVAAFVIILVYVKINQPEDKYFLVPFLMTYLVFTIFETGFLSIQARASS